MLSGLASAIQAAPLVIRVFPASPQPEAVQTMRAFSADLDRNIRAINAADTATTIINSTRVAASNSFQAKPGQPQMEQVIDFSSDTIGVIQQRSYDAASMSSDFAFKPRPGQSGVPNVTTNYVHLATAGSNSTAAAVSLHKVVILYIAAREAFAAQRPGEALFYVSAAQSLLGRRTPPQLAGVAQDLAVLASTIRVQSGGASR